MFTQMLTMIKDSEDYNIIGSRRIITSLGKDLESVLLSRPCEANILAAIQQLGLSAPKSWPESLLSWTI